MNSLKFFYTVEGNNFQIAGESSSQLKKDLKKLGLPSDIIRRVAISVYEAEINMVIHASGGSIDCLVSNNEIIVEMNDNGPGIDDVEKAMQEGFTTAPDHIRELGFGAGMGLPNIKKYTDELHIESEKGVGTKLRFVIRLN